MDYKEVRLKVHPDTYKRILVVSKSLDIPIAKLTKHALMKEVLAIEMILKATDVQLKVSQLLSKEGGELPYSLEDIYAAF